MTRTGAQQRRRLDRIKRVDPFADGVEDLVKEAEAIFKAKQDAATAKKEGARLKAREHRERIESYLRPSAETLPEPQARPWASKAEDDRPFSAEAIRSQLAKEQTLLQHQKRQRIRNKDGAQSNRQTKLPAMSNNVQNPRTPQMQKLTNQHIESSTRSLVRSHSTQSTITRKRTRLEPGKTSKSRQRLLQAQERDTRLGLTPTRLASSRSSQSLSQEANTTPAQVCSFVRAMHSLDAAEPLDLSFQRGEIIKVLRESEDGWNYGENHSTHQKGYYPINFVSPCGTPEEEAAREDDALQAGKMAADLAEAICEDASQEKQPTSMLQTKQRKQKQQKSHQAASQQISLKRADHALPQQFVSNVWGIESSLSERHQVHHRVQESTTLISSSSSEAARAATKVQSVRRGQVARRYVQESKAATKLQSARRGQVARRYVQESKAATKVQSARRGQMARRFVRESRAATKLQSARRGQVARRGVQEETKAATQLQALRRGQMARRFVQESQAATKLQSARRGQVARRCVQESKAATKVQSVRRGQIARRLVQEETRAATQVQALRRGQLARERARKMRENSIPSDEDVSLEATLAATKLQSACRGKAARKKFHESKAAIKVQAACRGQLARGRVQRIKKGYELASGDSSQDATFAATKLQSARRGQVARRYIHETKAATKLQKFYRSKAARLLADEFDTRGIQHSPSTTKEERMRIEKSEIWDDDAEDELSFVDASVVPAPVPASVTPLKSTATSFNVTILPDIPFVDNFTPEPKTE